MNDGHSRPVPAGLLIVMLPWLLLLGGADWTEYRPASFPAIKHSNVDWFRSCGPCVTPGKPFRVRVGYTGELRALTAQRGELLRQWAVLPGADIRANIRYSKEIRVTEYGSSYWLPIADDLEAALRENTTPGARLELYVLLVAAHDSDWVFIIQRVRPVDLAGG